MTEVHGSDESDQSTDELIPDVRHEIFSVTRVLQADRATVFGAFADDLIRRRWVRLPGSGATYDHVFRVGGGEDATSTFVLPDGSEERLRNRSRYLDIVSDRRIVFVYEAIVNAVTRWVSLVTVTFDDADGGGTTVIWTEQVTFLTRSGDGSADLPHLRTGTTLRLNALSAAIGGSGS